MTEINTEYTDYFTKYGRHFKKAIENEKGIIYQVSTLKEGKPSFYEVYEKRFYKNKPVYPAGSDFGTYGWTYPRIDISMLRLMEITKREKGAERMQDQQLKTLEHEKFE